MSQYPLGAGRDALDTPCLCVDLDRMERNIAHMAGYCREHGVDWRPHEKCHKVPAIARKQIEAGAIGVTCAKVTEAEVMAAGGVRDILIANQIVGRRKWERLVGLCHWADPIVAVDDLAQAEPLAALAQEVGVAPRVILEVDVGLNRSGVAPVEPAVDLAKRVARLDGLRLVGIMGYEGHLLQVADPDEKRRRIVDAMAQLAAVKQGMLDAGLRCDIVSAGGTGSFHITATCPGVTEIQAGGGIFMDPFYRDRCHVAGLEFALTVLTTVTSRPARGRAIVDAGRKTTNPDLHVPIVVGREGITVRALSAEHGALELDAAAEDLAIGDRLELVVGYGDFTTCLHDELYGFRNGRLEVVWPIAARGKIR